MTDAESAEERRPQLVPGVARAVSPLVRRILAANAGPMTGPGTNTYLVGIDEVAVIDPGPVDDAHLEAVVGCGSGRIRWIALTHTHEDHAPGTAALRARTGAEVVAFGPAAGIDVDRRLADGDTIEGTEFRLRALHTPGHASDHLCFLLEQERLLFSGDHIMQGSTVVIAPPDGDMAAYVEQLHRLRRLRLRAIAPGHGDVIDDPGDAIDAYLAHRLAREEAIVAALQAAGAITVDEIVTAVYVDVPEALHPVARFSVWAHLRKLAAEGRAAGTDLDGPWMAA